MSRKRSAKITEKLRAQYECPLRQLRLNRGMLQRELSLKSDIPISILSQIESGRAWPTTYNLILLRDALSCDFSDLLRKKSGAPIAGGRELLERVWEKREKEGIKGNNALVDRPRRRKSKRTAKSPETTDTHERIPIPPDPAVASRLRMALFDDTM